VFVHLAMEGAARLKHTHKKPHHDSLRSVDLAQKCM